MTARPVDNNRPVPSREAPARHAMWWGRLTLLWLAGNALRLTILCVPPLLPSIHRSLQLDETLVGALTSLPILVLAAASVPGSLLISRLGARRALVIGLGLIAVAGSARGLGESTPILFGMTFLMGVGIAVSQTSLPSLVQTWFPGSSGLATAVYTNGFLMGEIIAAALTGPLILPLVGGSWPLALVVWSAPSLLLAAGILMLTQHMRRGPNARAVLWWPDWRSAQTWRIGLQFGCASIAYFGSNAFIPDYLKAIHHPAYITAALTSLNLSQLPTSFLVGAAPALFIGRRWPLVMSGVLILAASAGFLMGGLWIVAWVGLMGFATALIFVLTLALPPIIGGADIHRLSAAMFTISYACAFLGSLLGGAVWDITGIPYTTFAPVIFAGVLILILVSRQRELLANSD